MALKLSCVDTLWVPANEPRVSSPFPSSTLRTAAGSSDSIATGTSSVRTPAREGKGPVEDEEDKDDDEDDNNNNNIEYDQIEMSQLYGAPYPT